LRGSQPGPLGHSLQMNMDIINQHKFMHGPAQKKQTRWGYDKCARLVRKKERCHTSKKYHHSNARADAMDQSMRKMFDSVRSSETTKVDEEERQRKNREWRKRREQERGENSVGGLDMAEEMRQEFVCTNCQSEMAPPLEIWQCTEGHAICGTCCDDIVVEEDADEDEGRHVVEVHVERADEEPEDDVIEVFDQEYDELQKFRILTRCSLCGSGVGGRNILMEQLAQIFYNN